MSEIYVSIVSIKTDKQAKLSNVHSLVANMKEAKFRIIYSSFTIIASRERPLPPGLGVNVPDY